MPFGDKEKHDCFGKIRMSKYQGDSQFFGSNVTHHGGVVIEISRASYERSISHDWFSSDEKLIEVRLSPLQFAELITTGMNTDGVPCTIHRDHNGRVEQRDFADSMEQFNDEYNEDIENQVKGINNAINLVNKSLSSKSVKKSDLKVIQAQLSKIHQDITSNMPYVRKCFDEHVQKSVLEAKTSVESFIESKVRQLGVESLKGLAVSRVEKELGAT